MMCDTSDAKGKQKEIKIYIQMSCRSQWSPNLTGLYCSMLYRCSWAGASTPVCCVSILHLSAESSRTPDGVVPRWRSHEALPEDYQTWEHTHGVAGGNAVINHAW